MSIPFNSANFTSKWFLALNREETCFQWPMNKSLNQKKTESMKQGAPGGGGGVGYYTYFGYGDVPSGRDRFSRFWYKERYRFSRFWYKERYQFSQFSQLV